MAQLDELVDVNEMVPPRKPQAKEGEFEVVENEHDQAWYDMVDSIDILLRSQVILNYIADPLLCKTVSKREREAARRQAKAIREWLDKVEIDYDEV